MSQCQATHKWKLLTNELDMYAEFDTIHATRTFLYTCQDCGKLWNTKELR